MMDWTTEEETEHVEKITKMKCGDFGLNKYDDSEGTKFHFQAFNQRTNQGVYGYGDSELEALKNLQDELMKFEELVKDAQTALLALIAKTEAQNQCE